MDLFQEQKVYFSTSYSPSTFGPITPTPSPLATISLHKSKYLLKTYDVPDTVIGEQERVSVLEHLREIQFQYDNCCAGGRKYTGGSSYLGVKEFRSWWNPQVSSSFSSTREETSLEVKKKVSLETYKWEDMGSAHFVMGVIEMKKRCWYLHTTRVSQKKEMGKG